MMNYKLVAKSNFVLRKILNTKDNVDIIQNMIESILGISIQTITINPYLQERETYLPQEENFGICDVRIRTTQNEEKNIGMQFVTGKYIKTKMLWYHMQIHQNQFHYPDNRKQAKTITIHFLDFPYSDSLYYHKRIKIPTKSKINQKEAVELHVLELPKLQIQSVKNMNQKEAWIFFLAGNNPEIIKWTKKKNKYISKLDNQLDKYWKEERMI